MSILEDLEGQRVVEFERIDGGIRVRECCDRWFSATLTLEEFDKLLTELAELRATPPDLAKHGAPDGTE